MLCLTFSIFNNVLVKNISFIDGPFSDNLCYIFDKRREIFKNYFSAILFLICSSEVTVCIRQVQYLYIIETIYLTTFYSFDAFNCFAWKIKNSYNPVIKRNWRSNDWGTFFKTCSQLFKLWL